MSPALHKRIYNDTNNNPHNQYNSDEIYIICPTCKRQCHTLNMSAKATVEGSFDPNTGFDVIDANHYTQTTFECFYCNNIIPLKEILIQLNIDKEQYKQGFALCKT